MTEDYKFFDENWKAFKDYMFDESNIPNSDDSLKLRPQNSAEAIPDKQLIQKCINLLEENKSPLNILNEKYPDQYPEFDYYFFEVFSEFCYQNGPDSDELMKKIVFSCEKNSYNFAKFIQINFLLLKTPFSFELFLNMMESNRYFINHFFNSGGIFILLYYSKDLSLQLNISQIFLKISYSNDYILDFEQFLHQPEGFTCIDENIECNYSSLLQNLLFSPNQEVQINCLKSINIIVYKGRYTNRSNSFFDFLIFHFEILLKDHPYLRSFILDISHEFDDPLQIMIPLLESCHNIFYDNEEKGIKTALFFMAKNMGFICQNDEIASKAFSDLQFVINNSSFDFAKWANCITVYFLSLCSQNFYQPAIQSGIFQKLADLMFAIDLMVERDSFYFLMEKLFVFLQKLADGGSQFILGGQTDNLVELIRSLQQLLGNKDSQVANSARICISKINGLLGGSNFVQ